MQFFENVFDLHGSQGTVSGGSIGHAYARGLPQGARAELAPCSDATDTRAKHGTHLMAHDGLSALGACIQLLAPLDSLLLGMQTLCELEDKGGAGVSAHGWRASTRRQPQEEEEEFNYLLRVVKIWFIMPPTLQIPPPYTS